ncbi:hypothetical protein C0J52_05746 [Blattella germanica]|nr:hypothetical protein C0J52_05746 [Blattella germanica]
MASTSGYNKDEDSKPDDREASGSEPEVLSHQELLEITRTTLNDLLKRDDILSDLPNGVTLEEVQAQIALEHGQSMTVHQQGATVVDLKRAIRRHFTLRLTRYQRSSVNISWRYIWRSNWLVHEGVKLKNDQALLADYGIRNKSQVSFVKKLDDRGERR